MEQVKDLILYQVATDRNYKVGDKLVFDKFTPNGQFSRVFKTPFKLDGKRPCDILYNIAGHRFKRLKKNQLYELAHILEYYDVFVKELALEEVRSESFADYPSRLHCMYLSISKDIALQNIEAMAKNREKKGSQFQAVAVKLNGKIFKAGKFYMSRESESYEQYKEKSYSYWVQKDLKDEEVKEVLFEGEAEIVEIIKEIKVKNKYNRNK